MCVVSSDGKGHHKWKGWRWDLILSNPTPLLMPRWSKIMSTLGHRLWLLFLMLIFLLLLFHKFSGLRSPRHSSCRPPQPRWEILTQEEEEGFEAWKEEQMKRRIRVKKFCNKEKGWKETWLNDPNIHPLMFQHNAQYSLTGCLQPKVFESSKHNQKSSKPNQKSSKLNQNWHLWARWHRPHGTNISIVWSRRQDEKSFRCYQGRSRPICCQRLRIRMLRLSSQLLSHSPWSGILLRGSSQPTRIRWAE